MPAARTPRASKRGHAKGGEQLPWTTYAFVPNVTPGTFNDPPPPPPLESEVSPESPPKSRRGSGHKKKPPGHIPRPPNAFILFRSAFVKNRHVSRGVETNHSTLSKIIGLAWNNLPPTDKEIWYIKAKEALDRHLIKWPGYAFKPEHVTPTRATKRKHREVPPADDERCSVIADLIVAGLTGDELDDAVKEFDRYHVPEIVTRFDTPITASSYTRSSSAPVAKATRRSSQPRASSSQPRASSSQPVPSVATSSSSQYSSPSPSPSEFEAHSVPYLSSPSPSSMSSFDQSDLYSLPDAEHSFNFDEFSFTESPVVDHSEPFIDLNGALEIFSQSSQETSYQPQNHVYAPVPLTIDTAYLDDWMTSSSPFSSMPGTPQSFDATFSSLPGTPQSFAATLMPGTPQSFAVTHMSEQLMSGSHCMPAVTNVYDAPQAYMTHGAHLAQGAPQYVAPGDLEVFDTSAYGYNFGPKTNFPYQMPASNDMPDDFGLASFEV